MEHNNSRRTFLMIIGVAILVIGLVGLTYAFFNYTRTGSSNVIKVGRISFNTSQTDTISLLNVFPIDSTNARSDTTNTDDVVINITGDTTYNEGLEYLVTVSSLTNRVGTKKIPIDILVSAANLGDEDANYFDNRGGDSSIYQIVNEGTIKNNEQLIVGYITKGSTGINGSVTIRAYLDKNKIAISDTYPEKTKYVVNSNMTQEEMDYCNSYIDLRYRYSLNTTALEFCEGTGTIAGSTFQEMLDQDKINTSYKNDLLGHNIVIESYTDGTTNEWVDERTILTTDEWNSLQENGVSFQVKVEANEGIWVDNLNIGYLRVKDAIKNYEGESTDIVWIDNMETENDTSDDIIYFSGDNDHVNNNYVWYSGKLWRITAIYPDGAMKLVTQKDITMITYNGNSGIFYTDENTKSYVYQWLNEDFYDTLYNAQNIIDTTKLWNATNSDASNQSGVAIKLPNTTMVSAKVGMINSNEYYNSYRCIGDSNCANNTYTAYRVGYLNNGYYWWMLNPHTFTYSQDMWCVDSYGGPFYYSHDMALGIRPAIYIKPNLIFRGEGTVDNPYTLEADIETGASNELINTRVSGEYVKLKNGNNEQVFKIIGIEDNKTKIIAMDNASPTGSVRYALGNTNGSGTKYGLGQTVSSEGNTWYSYLNGAYYNDLVQKYGSLFDSGTYYFGQVTNSSSYKTGVCASNTTDTIKECQKTSDSGVYNVGISRYGEMFAAQERDGGGDIWLINRSSDTYVWYMRLSNSSSQDYPSNPTYATNAKVRPTLHLKSTVKILSGSGTETDPYVVGL